MSHLTIELALDRQRTLQAEAAAYRRSAAVRAPRPKRSLSAVLARVRRVERRVAAPLSA